MPDAMTDCVVIRTRYHGPTDYKGSRISATDPVGNRLYVSLDHARSSPENHRGAAETFVAKRLPGRKFVGGGQDAKGYVYLYR